MPNSERQRRLEELHSAALKREASDRDEFLRQACGGDTELRRAVESLLSYEQQLDGFLVVPALQTVSLDAIAQEQSQAGQTLGPYRLLQPIGSGGMGEVWLAEQKQPVRRRVALKLIKAGMDTLEVVARFESERQALALMDHPNIAKVFDAGATPRGRPYFVMEYVTGIPITDYCDKHKMTLRERLELFVHVCEGVQHAHQKAIIHRDLKPSNILVSEVDGKPLPRIIDFGLAKATSQPLTAETLFTRAGAIVGTPTYMSPEQAGSTGVDVDTRTDVYSLGVVLYELLVGALPLDFHKLAFDEILRRLREEESPRPSTKLRTLGELSGTAAQNRGSDPPALARQLRGDLDAIALKALEKERSRRYATPVELAADIGRYLRHEPVWARPASAAYRARKYIRRHRVGVAVAAGLVVVLISFGVAQTLQLRRTTRERDRANRITAFMTGMFKVSDPSEARGNSVTAREILDKASKEIDTGLSKDPQLQAQMMGVMGYVYSTLGLYAKADLLLRRAVEIQRRTLGARNPDTLKSIRYLTIVLPYESHYAEAEKLAREIIDADRREVGSEDRLTLSDMTWLAWILTNERHYPEAEKLNREALEVARRVYGSQEDVAQVALLRLAIVLAEEGKYSEAEKAFREELEDDRRRRGSDSPFVLAESNNLAEVLMLEGKFAEAEKQNKDALESYRRVLGPEHPQTLACMGSLAQVLSSEKRYAEAETLFRRTLQSMRKVFGPEQEPTLSNTGNLADVLTEEGRYAEAGQLIRQSLEAERRILGPANSNTLAALDVLGKLMKREERYPEAEKAFRETLESRRRVLGDGHPDTASTAYKLASVLALEGKRDEAFDYLRFAVEHALPAETRLGLEKDTDLKSLHGDPRFDPLLASANQGGAAPQKSN